MSAAEALKAARAAGIRLSIDGNLLKLEAAAAPPSALLDLLSCHRSGMVAMLRIGADGWSGVDWLSFFDKRAGIAEFDRGLPREKAGAQAFEACVSEWLNHNPVCSLPGYCLGCNGRELAHDPLLPFGVEPTGHAWLHSRCWCAWYASREVEAIAALAVKGIVPPRGTQVKELFGLHPDVPRPDMSPWGSYGC